MFYIRYKVAKSCNPLIDNLFTGGYQNYPVAPTECRKLLKPKYYPLIVTMFGLGF